MKNFFKKLGRKIKLATLKVKANVLKVKIKVKLKAAGLKVKLGFKKVCIKVKLAAAWVWVKVKARIAWFKTKRFFKRGAKKITEPMLEAKPMLLTQDHPKAKEEPKDEE